MSSLSGVWSTDEFVTSEQVRHALNVLGLLVIPDGMGIIELQVRVGGIVWTLKPITVVEPDPPLHLVEP